MILGNQFDGSPCEGYTSDQRVQVLTASSYLYPNLSVVCGSAEFNTAKNPENLLNPTLIVAYRGSAVGHNGRNEKFILHRQLPSLRQYLMLDSQPIHVKLHTQQNDDHWLFGETRDLAAVLDLRSVGATLPLASLYGGVPLEGQG